MTELRRRFIRDLKIKNYSDATIKIYVRSIENLSKHFGKCPSLLTEEDIKNYLGHIVSLNHSWSHVNIIQNALKKLYRDTLQQEYKIANIKRPKLVSKVTSILSREEIVKLLDSCSNIKHKVIFMTMYACGLRVSEVCSLQISDIDSSRMVIQVKNPKGHKQREVKMPEELLEWLRLHIKSCPSKDYVFKGQGYINKITPRTISEVFRQKIVKTGIVKKVSTHALRHTHATHCIEEGSDVLAVQKNLGHKNIRTTLIYYHLTAKLQKTLISPLETLPSYGKRAQ